MSDFHAKKTKYPELFKKTFYKWSEDKASRMAAALSYYTVFSLAPLLVIAIALAGALSGKEAVEGRLFDQISGMLGTDGARSIEIMIASAYKVDQGLLAGAIGTIALLFGATGLFVQLQDSLDSIWSVRANPKVGIWGYIKSRWMSFSLILVIGFLLLVSLLFTAMISFLADYSSSIFTLPAIAIQLLNQLISILITAGLFAMIFKILPNVHISWSDLWPGAILSSILFSVGKYAIAEYLGKAALTSSYGAAGSLVIVLVWSYYSAQILLIGAEFTSVYAKERGSNIKPKASYEFSCLA